MSGHKAGPARVVVHNRIGFSLVEIIIVVGMMAVLSTITMINFKGNTIQDRVQAAANITQSHLTLARTYARTGKICCGDQTPGYGVIFDTVSLPQVIKIYADLNNSQSYSVDEDEIIAFATIDEKVEFMPNIYDLFFATDGSGKMDGEDWSSNSTVSISVQGKNSPTEKKIVRLYYPSGLIDQP